MPDNITKISFQVRRGTKAALEARLVASDLGVPKDGEIVFETDTRQFKVGNGQTDYLHLSYISFPAEDQAKLEAALEAATAAHNSAVAAAGAQGLAEAAAIDAEAAYRATQKFVHDKLWFGTVEEYNALETITPESFYFITPTASGDN